jgi:hypothetical protein
MVEAAADTTRLKPGPFGYGTEDFNHFIPLSGRDHHPYGRSNHLFLHSSILAEGLGLNLFGMNSAPQRNELMGQAFLSGIFSIVSVHPKTLIFPSPSMGEGRGGGDNDWK